MVEEDEDEEEEGGLYIGDGLGAQRVGGWGGGIRMLQGLI